jgi:putative ABC transport system permease protein
MPELLREIRSAARNLARAPGFTTVVVATLALGIGANTAIFSVVNAVLLRPLPFDSPDRLAVVWESRHSRPGYHMFASPPNFQDWRDATTAFEDLAAFRAASFFITGREESLQVQGSWVTDGLFEVLGVRPIIGRTFTPDDARDGAEPVLILGHGLWQREFEADPGIVGGLVTLDTGPATVVGVMPPDFDFPPPIDLEGETVPVHAEIWRPQPSGPSAGGRGAHYLTVIGRLAPGATSTAAAAELRTLAGRLEQEYPQTNADWTVLVEPFDQVVVGPVRTSLLVLFGAVAGVLLIACVNVANLMLARSTGRQREYALRAAIGASRPALLRQALIESQLLSLAGGLAGVALANVGVAVLLRLAPRNVPRLEQAGIDPAVIAFAFVASVLTGLLFGLLPALRAFSPDLLQYLRSGSRGDDDASRFGRMRSALVIAEVALSLVLLIGAGLLFNSFLALRAVDTGYAVERVLTMRVSLPRTVFEDNARQVSAFQTLEERVAALPGVAAAGFALNIPLASDFQGTALIVAGDPEPRPDEDRNVNFGVVSPGWFDAMGMSIVAGRGFGAQDGPDDPLAVVVNESLVRRFFADRDPIGRGIVWGSDQPRTIIGVVADARLENLGRAAPAAMYFPRYQPAQSVRGMGLVVRTVGEPGSVRAGVRDAIRAFDPSIAVYDVREMRDIVAESVAQPRFSALMLLVFSAVALLLAAVGIYGVMSYDVGRRTREIGIRMALGARPFDAQGMILGHSLRLLAVGVSLGLLGAFALTRVLRSLLFEISPTDPATLIVTTALLAAVAMLSAWLPAHRASTVDPLVALRSE